ncbi:hypothetical protein Vadar_016704 [Vaccinium darrowii]|uniref:Uncharacterized protein n=1 Tax=Vaccinium darrowii TaxID=229202 RepID=A0ACB7YNG2_9ERIC|nr:hypothetical protein Vadar_016704 [Vaccinium darrowii]
MAAKSSRNNDDGIDLKGFPLEQGLSITGVAENGRDDGGERGTRVTAAKSSRNNDDPTHLKLAVEMIRSCCYCSVSTHPENNGTERHELRRQKIASWGIASVCVGALLLPSTASFEDLPCEDPDIHFKYIEAAAKTGQIKEVEHVPRESNFCDTEKTKNFLVEAKLPDARPLINVCNRFGFVPDLTHYLYSNNMLRYIEGYVVQKVRVTSRILDYLKIHSFVKYAVLNSCYLVVRQLQDDEHPEDFIENLILSVRSLLPVEPLVDECDKSSGPNLCLPFCLLNCSESSHLAHVLRNRLRLLTQFLEHLLYLRDQVVSTALPESKRSEQVSAAVKAFMSTHLPNELIEPLEKIVLQNSVFSGNFNLRNLLVLTAIKVDPSRANAASGMAVDDECKLKFSELKTKRNYRFIIFKIEDQKVVVEKVGSPEESYEDFSASLPADECRYSVFDFDFTTEENCQKSKIFFIAWSPETARVRMKMVYASSKDRFKRELDGIQVELQATDPSEMSFDIVKCRAL